MAQDAGELYQVFVLCALLSSAGAWIIAGRYRRRMQQLMRAPIAGGSPSAHGSSAVSAAEPAPGVPVSLAANRAAGLRLTMLLIVSSCLAAATSAGIFAALMFPADPLTFWRVLPIAVLQLWPLPAAIVLLWRVSRPRMLAVLLLWCAGIWAVLFAIAIGRELDVGPALALRLVASEAGLSLALLSVVFLAEATRAIAPWLLVPAAVLSWSSLAGIRAMVAVGEGRSPAAAAMIARLDPVLGWLPWYVVLLLFVLVPWAVAVWPARMLGRALGRAYARKWFSDLVAIHTAVWAFALTDRALTVATQTGAGAAALAMYLPLLSIPVVFRAAGRRGSQRGHPPTLLVLRVFQQDAQARSLFDHVVERWRLSGNTVMIAGTDLADRTIDADDIFQFLDGTLAARFIVSGSDVARRIDAFDMDADIDGRHRVNECYCHDATWQDALQALVRRSHVVLMDLRGFQAHNAGCRYELATLTQSTRPLRVVVLTDERTDRRVADEIVASGRYERFTWIDASRFDAGTRRAVFARLFG